MYYRDSPAPGEPLVRTPIDARDTDKPMMMRGGTKVSKYERPEEAEAAGVYHAGATGSWMAQVPMGLDVGLERLGNTADNRTVLREILNWQVLKGLKGSMKVLWSEASINVRATYGLVEVAQAAGAMGRSRRPSRWQLDDAMRVRRMLEFIWIQL